MKKITLIALLLIGNFSFASSYSEPPIEKIEKYKLNPENTIKVPTDFAKEFILTPEMLEPLKGKKIHHVDLIYTAFKESEDFNQQALNKRRQQQLMKALPQIASDNPTWKMIEQEGAKTSEEAHDYFHGFVIHIGDELSFEVLSEFFKPYQTPFTNYAGDNKKDKEFNYPSGTTLKIPANAVTYADGRPVQGGYTIEYKEFRSQSDIAYSGIPMDYSIDGEELTFSSAGMYEIRANKNGEELKLNKPITVDFNCTKKAEGVDFYQMDDETGEWEQLQKIEFKEEPKWKPMEKPVDFDMQEPEAVFIQGQTDSEPAWEVRRSKDKVVMKLSDFTWKKASPKIKNEEGRWKSGIKYFNSNDKEVSVMYSDSASFSKFLSDCIVPPKKVIGGTLLAEGVDAGHTYPNLVKGLNSESFGVYNCDQVRRLQNPIALSPIYLDSESGKEIKNKYVTCVLDLNFNGSMSFQPNNITCDVNGETVILLFTEDDKTYMLAKEELKPACKDKKTSPRFLMKDMTAILLTSDDLKELLEL